MDLNHAIAAHVEWKTKLRSAINSQSKLDVATIGRDDCCELGKWLHGEARLKYGSLASHAQCMSAHAAFHREAGSVARTIALGRFADAEKALNSGTPFDAASGQTATAIIRLKKEAGL